MMTSLLSYTHTHLLPSSFQSPASWICGHVMNMHAAMPTDVTKSEKMIILVLSTRSNLYRVMMAPPMKPPAMLERPGSAATKIYIENL